MAAPASPSGGRKLTLGFGLVNIPIALKPLMEARRRTGGHYLCATHMSRVKMKYECENGHLLAEGERITGYEVPGTITYVTLDPSVVDDLADEKTGVAKIERVVDFASIDPIYLGSAYIAYPQKGAGEGFDLIQGLLRSTGKAIVATAVLSKQTVQIVIRYSEQLETCIGHVCEFAENIRESDLRLVREMAGVPEKAMLALGEPLFAALAGEFDPKAVEDTYTLALDEAIVAAGKGKPLSPKRTEKAPGELVDLMEALKASVASAAKPKGRKKVAA